MTGGKQDHVVVGNGPISTATSSRSGILMDSFSLRIVSQPPSDHIGVSAHGSVF